MAILAVVNELDKTEKHRALTLSGLKAAVVQDNWPPQHSSVLPAKRVTEAPEPGGRSGAPTQLRAASSRSSRRRILPVTVFGSSSMISSSRGYL